MKHTFRTKGVCASQISFELEGNTVSNVQFFGGCNGNLKAIAKLVEGMDAERVIELLSGNTCGFKKTSCADQLTVALREALDNQ
ncbi:MAG: TIGR03905 family TSCPD domain-containing protein [Clostridia bacterium]|nr:TIGR03905 family TSCPD domain-containing protein [Clostridia bacterium]